MYIAVKGNREEVIEEKNMNSYLNNGYDIYEKKDGKIALKTESTSKKVSYAQYQKVVKENEKLKAENSKLKKADK